MKRYIQRFVPKNVVMLVTGRNVFAVLVLIVATVIALTSLSYPFVTVSSSSTEAFAGLITGTTQYAVSYPQMSSSTVVAGYLTSTAWYPGNPLCDPASNACTPYPAPTATIIIPQAATYAYQVTLQTTTYSTYFSLTTTFSTQITSQSVPLYSAAGLSDFEFGIVALVVAAAVGLCAIFVVLGRPRPGTAKPITYCQKCWTANSSVDKFCTNCGKQLVHPSS